MTDAEMVLSESLKLWGIDDPAVARAALTNRSLRAALTIGIEVLDQMAAKGVNTAVYCCGEVTTKQECACGQGG